MMLTYWDLSEKERADLTEEDVERFLSAELMSKGVLRAPSPPTLPKAETDVERIRVFRVQGKYSGMPHMYFRTDEQARAFLRLEPMWESSEYVEHQYIRCVKNAEDCEIVATDELTSDAFAMHRKDIEKSAAEKSAYKKQLEVFTKACDQEREALAGLWDDWHRCRAAKCKADDVARTFAEYVTLAADPIIARGFLAKVFTEEDIVSARAMAGVDIP